MNLGKITQLVSKVAGRAGLKLQSISPGVLVVGGVVGLLATVVLASRASFKAEEVWDDHLTSLDRIEKASHAVSKETYTDTDIRNDKIIVYTDTVKSYCKLYGPSVALAVVSTACILGGHKLLAQRFVGVLAAYKGVQKSFNEYRGRVADELGVERELMLKNGIKLLKVDTHRLDETGEEITVTDVIKVVDTNDLSTYARFFDESSKMWSKIPGYNAHLIKSQQSVANDTLKSRGHLFLNEVYELLGLPHTKEGSVVGWVRGQGDDFVDFNMYDSSRQPVRDFVNGYERTILLDFNVDGVIWDMI